jgi:predicted permease
MSWFSRLKNALYTRPLDESLEDEIQDHLERRSAAFRLEGLTPVEARRRALTAFGSVTRVREQSREIRLWAGLDGAIQDVRYAWRTMRRSPAFTITALLSLSLAIGANTAIYAIVDAAMLRPLPVPDAKRVFTLAAPALEPAVTPATGETESFSYPLYLQLRAAAGHSARLGVFGPTDRAEAQGPDPTSAIERVRQQFVSGEAFDMLRLPPALGRLFSSNDDRDPGVPRIAVLSFDYWRRHFNADPGVLGQPITLNNRQYHIVGVASEGFFGVEPGKFVDIWLPVMTFDPGVFSNPAANLFRIVGRLDGGTSREQLQARLQPVFHDRQQEVIAQNPAMPAAALRAFGERGIRVRPGGIGVSDFQRSFARPIWIVWSVAAAILLVACANVASLLLSRSAARSPEMSLRTSLGATRGRLVRQLLTESLLLSGLASGLGWMFASAAAPWIVTLLSTDSDPVRFALAMDTRVLLFCAGICTATALIVGVLPAWHGAGVRAMSAATPGSGEARRVFLGRLFVSVQVAFVFCLVVAGAGFLFSLHKLSTVDMGFDPAHVTVLTMRSDLGPKQDGLKLTQQLQRQVSMLPNVHGAAVGWWAIFGDSRRAEQIVLEGRPPSERQETFYRISPGYFATLRTPLLEGRDFDVRDNDGIQPIPTIVNRAFARRYFGGEPVLGQEFQRRTDNARHLIVGVAADAYYSDLRDGLQPVVYFPMKPPRLFTLYVRSTLDPGSVMRLVEQETRAAGPGLHVVEVTTLETLIGNTLLKEKLLAGVGGMFASLGLVLVAIGLFGLLSYSVVRRTKEIGIRAALGARRPALISLVLKELFGMMAGGLTAGLLGSLALMRLVHSQLFGIATVDPVVMAAAAAVFLLTTSVAVVLPAYRAATMDPMVALRQE